MRKAIVVLILTLVAAACSPAGDTASGSTTTVLPLSTTAATTTVASTTVAPGTTAPAESVSCFNGEWTLDSEQFFADITASGILGSADTSMESRGGENILTISDAGTLTSERRSWSWVTIIPEGELQVTVSAIQSGTYSMDGPTLAVAFAPAEVTELAMSLNGVPSPVPAGFSPASTFDTDASISCEGDVLTAISGDGFASTWHRS